MSGNKWWSIKVSAKLFSVFQYFYSDIPLDFHNSVRVVPLKCLMHFLVGINTK